MAEVYDSVMFYHNQCYNYTVTEADKDLRVKLESYSGDPNIFVHPLSLPPVLGDFAFNSRDHFENEELILTPGERAKFNATQGVYYICIFGNTAATYKLTVRNEDHDIFLKSGLSESGYLDHNELQLFYFRDPILAENGTNVSFSLHMMIGKARLRAKLCPVNFTDTVVDYKEKCALTVQDMLSEDTAEPNMNHLGSEVA